MKSRALVVCSERLDGIPGDDRQKGDVGQRLSVRSPEPQFAVGLSFHLKPLLVDGAVVPPTE
jgi:hypothetical protein